MSSMVVSGWRLLIRLCHTIFAITLLLTFSTNAIAQQKYYLVKAGNKPSLLVLRDISATHDIDIFRVVSKQGCYSLAYHYTNVFYDKGNWFSDNNVLRVMQNIKTSNSIIKKLDYKTPLLQGVDTLKTENHSFFFSTELGDEEDIMILIFKSGRLMASFISNKNISLIDDKILTTDNMMFKYLNNWIATVR